jgi:D-3-phosphoglycerate dehydrogenase / 2-oxoglutarate reductase
MKSVKKVLVTDRITESAELYLKQFPFLQIKKSNSPRPTPEDLLYVNALLIRSRTKIDSQIFERAKNLQVIVTCTSGFDHIDLAAAQKWGVTVMHTPEANVQSAAELTMMHLLLGARKWKKSQVLLESGVWKREHVIGSELRGKKLGIVGLGRIGKRVAELARAFGMNPAGHDPYLDDSVFEKLSIPKRSLEDIFSSCDFVTLHVPRTKKTTAMIHRGLLEKSHPQLILINASRGEVVVEKDLIAALHQGKLAGACLDVFESEPLSTDSPLLQMDQVHLTPHLGAQTEDAYEKASHQGALQIAQFFQDGSTSSLLPPRASWYFDEI